MKDLVLTLGTDNINVARWWVDGAFAVHPNMKEQTRATMSFGEGCLTSWWMKQQINTKSSTKTELVGVDNALPHILWTAYFLEAQGYKVKTSEIYQDNLSAMLLEKNGKWSSGKRTKHINVRYFFIKDRITSGEIKIKHCGTEDMVADFFTKPLQGAQFRKFRAAILNLEEWATTGVCWNILLK